MITHVFFTAPVKNEANKLSVAFYDALAENESAVEVLGNVSERGRHRGGHVELRLDSPTGKLLGKTTIDSTNGEKKGVIEIEETTGRHDVYLVFKSDDDNAETRIAAINGIQFRNR
mgnify:CR=1 FL=1